MSWLARSIANSLKLDSDPDVISGIRSDFAEIGGKFKSGISRLSNNINVSEITKMASDFLQLGSDNEGFHSAREGAVGVTEEVVAFACDIALHPGTWLDFPLPENVDDDVDFDMSDAQQEHALAVERLVPRLSALRIELCPGCMAESHFWKIYFVLLHPRLDSHDAELLSTPEILKARDLLSQELKYRTSTKLEDMSKENSFNPEISTRSQNEEPLSVPPLFPSGIEINQVSVAPADSETLNHQTEINETQIDEKHMIKEKDAVQCKDQTVKSGFSNVWAMNDEDDVDDWLKEENSETFAASGVTVPIENEDEVSLSDLEDDDEDASSSFKKSDYSCKKDSPELVQPRKSSSDSSKDIDIKNSDNECVYAHDTKESNDWLDVYEVDVA